MVSFLLNFTITTELRVLTVAGDFQQLGADDADSCSTGSLLQFAGRCQSLDGFDAGNLPDLLCTEYFPPRDVNLGIIAAVLQRWWAHSPLGKTETSLHSSFYATILTQNMDSHEQTITMIPAIKIRYKMLQFYENNYRLCFRNNGKPLGKEGLGVDGKTILEWILKLVWLVSYLVS